jgi:hydrogenase-4 component E
MFAFADFLLLLVVLINLYLLGVSRMNAAIQILAIEGVLLAMLPFTVHWAFTIHSVIIPLSSLLIKGIIIPRLLFKALREVQIDREIQPFVGRTASTLMGALFLMISFWISNRLVLPLGVSSKIWVPVALFSVMIGLFLLISRRKAITQVLGYLVMENGIYLFALALVQKIPVLIEMGVLLDVFIGVFIMGIILNHIKDVFDDLDTENLTLLRD